MLDDLPRYAFQGLQRVQGNITRMGALHPAGRNENMFFNSGFMMANPRLSEAGNTLTTSQQETVQIEKDSGDNIDKFLTSNQTAYSTPTTTVG